MFQSTCLYLWKDFAIENQSFFFIVLEPWQPENAKKAITIELSCFSNSNFSRTIGLTSSMKVSISIILLMEDSENSHKKSFSVLFASESFEPEYAKTSSKYWHFSIFQFLLLHNIGLNSSAKVALPVFYRRTVAIYFYQLFLAVESCLSKTNFVKRVLLFRRVFLQHYLLYSSCKGLNQLFISWEGVFNELMITFSLAS